MKNETILSLFTDVFGVVGYLFREDGHLLSTAHPTTIAAAIFAMGECELVFLADTTAVKVPFPISVANMGVLLGLVDNRYEADFLIGLVKSSWFNFLNPHPADIQADSHLREAVSLLPKAVGPKRAVNIETAGGHRGVENGRAPLSFLSRLTQCSHIERRPMPTSLSPQLPHQKSSSLSTNAFAAAVGKGAALHKPQCPEAIRTGLIFGVIEGLTPVIGWVLGRVAAPTLRLGTTG